MFLISVVIEAAHSQPSSNEVVRQVEMPMHVILIDPFLNFMAYKVDPLVY